LLLNAASKVSERPTKIGCKSGPFPVAR